MASFQMGNLEALFYNALIAFIPAALMCAVTGDLQNAYYYDNWTDPSFLVSFLLSSIMGQVTLLFCLGKYTLYLC